MNIFWFVVLILRSEGVKSLMVRNAIFLLILQFSRDKKFPIVEQYIAP